jgi:hypothetical protein
MGLKLALTALPDGFQGRLGDLFLAVECSSGVSPQVIGG